MPTVAKAGAVVETMTAVAAAKEAACARVESVYTRRDRRARFDRYPRIVVTHRFDRSIAEPPRSMRCEGSIRDRSRGILNSTNGVRRDARWREARASIASV